MPLSVGSESGGGYRTIMKELKELLREMKEFLEKCDAKEFPKIPTIERTIEAQGPCVGCPNFPGPCWCALPAMWQNSPMPFDYATHYDINTVSTTGGAYNGN